MSNDLVQLTKSGMKQLRAELVDLVQRERPDILKRLAEARAHGDLSENAEYHAVKERKAIVSTRIDQLNDVLTRAEVFEPDEKFAEGKCVFGCQVKIALLNSEGGHKSTREFMLVHSLEADSNKARMSVSSPLGMALLGRQVGDIIDLTVPAGEVEYEVLEINYP